MTVDHAPHPADTEDRPAGRVPPHSLDAEASLLGAMMLSTDAIAAAVQIVHVDDFYKPAHAHVFDAICSQYAAGEPADPVSLAEVLDRAGLLEQIGGAVGLLDLESKTPATTNAAHYAKIIEERAMMRKLIGAGGEVAQLGYSLPDDVDKAVDTAESLVFRIANRRSRDTLAPLHDLLEPALDRMERLYEHKGELVGHPTGFDDLDKLLGGLPDGGLVVIGARPSVGKTALALNIASNISIRSDYPVLVFELEMSHQEVTQRILCSEARVDSRRIRNGQLTDDDWKKISRAVGRVGEAPLWIDENPALTVMELRAKARRLTSEIGRAPVIVVDYLQLMTSRTRVENRNLEVAEISRGLKILARELDTTVIALSQLSRGVEGRQDKRPTLADLRDSGSVEQDADVVVFIYRDALYDREKVDDGDTELIVAKHRNGPIGTAHVAFIPRYTRFEQAA